MLNTKKLLYILPDVAYVGELLEGKKPNSFVIQAFRQINGTYLSDGHFLAESVAKLLAKLEADSYHIILPDDLFTNTIVSIPADSDAKIKEHVTSVLLPSLTINTTTHQIETTVLNTFKGTARVQLSAIEKSVLAPLRVAVSHTHCQVAGLSPVSWTLKSVISLEPSISILQLGSRLYTCLHYIGIDQTSSCGVADISVASEMVQSLKGSEPNVQTVYLITNELVGQQLKDSLSSLVPLQQLVGPEAEETKIPSYVETALESAAKTMSISDYPVPIFELAKASQEDIDNVGVQNNKPGDESENDKIEENPEVKSDESTETNKTEPKLLKSDTVETAELPAPINTPVLPSPSVPTQLKEPMPEENTSAENETITVRRLVNTPEEPSTSVSIDASTDSKSTEVDLTQFVSHAPLTVNPIAKTSSTKPKQGAPSMLRMIVITLAVFCATVAVGIGVGIGLLSLSNMKNGNTTSPIASVSPTVAPTGPTATPVPTAAPAPTTKLETLKLLVVNATTKAGYAGTIATKLKAAGLKNVTATNAKGTYKTGNYLLAKDATAAAHLSGLQTASGLKITAGEKIETEDTKGLYDAVLVLAE